MHLFPTSLNVNETPDGSPGLCISLLAVSRPHTQGKTLCLMEACIKHNLPRFGTSERPRTLRWPREAGDISKPHTWGRQGEEAWLACSGITVAMNHEVWDPVGAGLMPLQLQTGRQAVQTRPFFPLLSPPSTKAQLHSPWEPTRCPWDLLESAWQLVAKERLPVPVASLD